MASEIDHRAMNSLQFVASLLHLQSRTAGPEAARQLTTAANRVLAVARVHRNFAADEDRRAACPYWPIFAGCAASFPSFSTSPSPSRAPTPPMCPPPQRAWRSASLVNELVTNAKKHGDGAIKVTFDTRADGQYELCVLDRGEGLPEGFSANAPGRAGIGMKVIAALVSQLDGKLTAGGNPAGPGACFTVAFPAT